MGTRLLLAGATCLLFVVGPFMVVACGGASPTAVAPTPLPPVLPQTDLRHAVASGGYVIFFRHAARDTGVLPTPRDGADAAAVRRRAASSRFELGWTS